MIANARLIYNRPAPAWPWRLAVAAAALTMTVLTALLVPLSDLLSSPPPPEIEYRTIELSDWRPAPPPPAPPLPRPPPPVTPPPQPSPRPTPRLEEPSLDPAPRLKLPVKLDFALSQAPADLALDFAVDPEVRDLPETTAASGSGDGVPGEAGSAPPPPPPPPERFDQPPTILSQGKPIYPHAARVRRLEGHVDLQFNVTAQGRVEQATVLAATPRNVFEEAALAAVARWQFSPALRAGRAVPARMQIRISFTLEDP